jgi:N-acetylglucosamine-6-sulfatase
VPLMVRGPGVPAGRKIGRLVGNADFAPTFAQWAGVAPPVEVDGRSFAGLLTAADPAGVPWRHALPLSKLPEAPTPERSAFLDRLDPKVTHGYACVRGGRGFSEMRGVRTDRYTFAQWAGGDLELYDRVTDPHQLQNAVCGAEPGLRSSLRDLAAALSACRGAECRRLEDTAVP